MVFAVTRIRERGSWLIARNHTLAAFRTRKNRQMSRTTQCIGLALAVVLIWLPLGALQAVERRTTLDKPNSVFIMADDHGRQAISCYGGRLIKTPNIDRLARGGTRFTQAFANNSICSPSRAVLLTGKYNHLCGVEKLDGHFNGAQQTFPKLLQRAGYQTAIVGKWHLFTEPTGFDYYCVLPGFGKSFDSPFKEIGQPWGDNGNRGGVVRPGYFTDVITDISLDWLKNKCEPGKPFCLMIHHRAPHSPHDPAPRHREMFKETVFPEPPTLLDDYRGRAPEQVADKLAWSRLLQQCEQQYQGVHKAFNGDKAHDTRLMYQSYLRNYLRMVVALDENVGRVLDYLDRTGLATNTVVIYTSDNGFFLGEHGFYNKMWMYEDGFQIPLIIRLPGNHGGRINPEIVSMMDIAPTILDLYGVRVPQDIQGCSMKPLLTGETAPWRESFYYHYYGYCLPRSNNWIASEDGEIFGIRTKTAKLICYPRWSGGPFWELFDLEKDPLEIHNLYADSSHRGLRAALTRQMRALAEQYKDFKTVAVVDALAALPTDTN